LDLEKDLEMARKLDEARLRGAALRDGRFDHAEAHKAYAEAFAWYGLEVDGREPQEAGQILRARSFPTQLGAALDDWALHRRQLRLGGWEHLLAVARVADPDPWRDRLRDPEFWRDKKRLRALAAQAKGEELAPQVAAVLGWVLDGEQATALLRAAQQRHPADFWVNFTLGTRLDQLKDREEAIGYLRVAVALRPTASVA